VLVPVQLTFTWQEVMFDVARSVGFGLIFIVFAVGEPITAGFEDTTRTLYLVPVFVPLGIVAEIGLQ
jgi:hypothetical protein